MLKGIDVLICPSLDVSDLVVVLTVGANEKHLLTFGLNFKPVQQVACNPRLQIYFFAGAELLPHQGAEPKRLSRALYDLCLVVRFHPAPPLFHSLLSPLFRITCSRTKASASSPSTPSQTLYLRKKKTSLASPIPKPLPARRRTRLRPPA